MQSDRGFEYGVKHIISPQSGRLSDVLLCTLDLDPDQTNFLLDLGSVYLSSKRIRDDISINAGDYLRIHTKPRRFLPDDGKWKSRIVKETEHYVIVDKIASLPVHASVDNLKENTQSYLSKAVGCELHITHRLDVPTQGLILYAKTKEFQSAFNALLASGGMTKIYRAKVVGHYPTTGILRHFMEPSPRAPKTVALESAPQWQECLLNVLSVNANDDGTSDLRIELITGRTHQIRAQLSHAGFPIVGDHAYGAPKIYSEEKIELKACELGFTDPITNEIVDLKI
jgi:23S rRNA pseudouridine1911/1915/1917 synthase